MFEGKDKVTVKLPALQPLVRHTFGTGRITAPHTVKEVLMAIQLQMIDIFQLICEEEEGDLPFLLFVHRIHEGSVVISQALQSKNPRVRKGLNADDIRELPLIRRVLKLITEALLKDRYDYPVSENLRKASAVSPSHVSRLEHLLYLGCWALEIKEYLNLLALFPGSVILKSSWKKHLLIHKKQPFKEVM